MLRYNMSESNLYAALSEELDYVKKYLTIQALRYSDRISLSDEVSPDHRGVTVLKFVLQPIVENSITHGVTEGDQRIAIRISSRKANGRLAISVEDDGAGIDPQRLCEIRKRLRVGSTDSDDRQIGLSNINRRLKLYYGQSAGVEVESTPGSGTRVTITFPLDEEGGT
jgi:two-component system sensor histidine kinase YesM